MRPSLPGGTTYPRGLGDAIRWPLVPARELFELKYGKALVRTQRRPGSVPVYGTNGRCGTHIEALFSGPGVIIGRKGQGPLGVEWCEEPYWVIDTAYSLMPLRPDVDLKFAYYLIKHIGLNHLKDGTSNPSLSRDTFGAQALPLPPLNVQRRIARILGALDDKMDLNRRTTGTLESIAHAIFQSWFIDVDPVCIKALASEADPSGDWSIAQLADLVVVHRDSVAPREIENETVDHYSIPAFDDNRMPAAEFGSTIKSNKFAVQTGSVLVSRLNPRIPRVWLPALRGSRRGVCSTEFMVLSPRPPFTREYLYGLLRTDGFGEELSCRVTGTSGSHQRVKPLDVMSIPVVSPPLGHIGAFSRLAAPLLEQVGLLREETRVLADLRDALLPRLVAGSLSSSCSNLEEGCTCPNS